MKTWRTANVNNEREGAFSSALTGTESMYFGLENTSERERKAANQRVLREHPFSGFRNTSG